VLKHEAREHFIEAGGTDEEFEEAWPELRLEVIQQRTLERVQTARQKSAEAFRSQF
jgi:hypothetical protein